MAEVSTAEGTMQFVSNTGSSRAVYKRNGEIIALPFKKAGPVGEKSHPSGVEQSSLVYPSMHVHSQPFVLSWSVVAP